MATPPWFRASMAALLLAAAPVVADSSTMGDGISPTGTNLLHAMYLAFGPLASSTVPGHPHEPNHPEDSYPGAIYSTCVDEGESYRGACNIYLGSRFAPRVFADLQASGTSPSIRLDGESVHPRQQMPPGAYAFGAEIGRWHDRPHRIVESIYLPSVERPECEPAPWALGLVGHVVCSYDVPPDGWVGNVVVTSHQYRWEGHLPEECRLNDERGEHEFAVCHPYRDGWAKDGNAYHGMAAADEFAADCELARRGDSLQPVEVLPERAVWTVVAFILRADGPSSFGVLEDWTGRTGPAQLATRCEGGRLETTDRLILPMGNLGLELRTTLRLFDPVWREALVDVDVYERMG